MTKTAILLSGGMDSMALAYQLRPDIAITIDYGQIPANAELQAAQQLCEALYIQHEVIRVDCSSLGSGDLLGTPASNIAPEADWWPFRNQLLITLAGARAVSIGVEKLSLGIVRSDSQHQDGTSVFVALMHQVMTLQEGGISIETPAIEQSTAELIKSSGIPMSLLSWAHSCHKSNVPCGNCRGCNKFFGVLGELEDGVD